MQPQTFSSLGLDPKILRAIDEMGFDRPTPIQGKGVPPALDGRDVLACAMTGSGKTAAFVLPIIQRLMRKPRGTTRALVLTPTRELAAQIVEHFQSLARFTQLRAAAVYGGVGMGPQETAFRKGVDVLVACPGRLLDHFSRPYARLRGLEILVLDEVDRMLDMGFLPDVKRVLRHLPDVDQHLFYSATLPAPIADLARNILNDPVPIEVERPSKPASGVTQTLWPVREDRKRDLLLAMIEKGEIYNALVFTRTKHRANRLAQYLVRRGVAAERIHGNRSQAQRTKALAAFKSGKAQILVATDIAARGIDVAELTHVVNFDVPHLAEDYIHRVGRTARAARTGDAYTFVSPSEEAGIRTIERALGKRLPREAFDGFETYVPMEAPAEPQRPERQAQRPSNHRQARPQGKAGGGSGRRRRPSRGRAGQGGAAQGERSRSHGAKEHGRGEPRRAEGRSDAGRTQQGAGRKGRPQEAQARSDRPRKARAQGGGEPRGDRPSGLKGPKRRRTRTRNQASRPGGGAGAARR
ncbi:MAG: DEAD/DEAH box helicase [Acidobacteriota bacterium]